MNRWLLLSLLLLALLSAPAALVAAGAMPRPETGLSGLGNGLYAATALFAAFLPAWRWRRETQKRPLPDILTRQGLTVCFIGLSGLLVLSAFAPRFPGSARGAYLAGIASIILFTMIPLGLLAYIRRKLP